MTSEATSATNSDSTVIPDVDDAAKAREQLETITGFAESARAAAADLQAKIAAVHADAQVKLAEITAKATAAKTHYQRAFRDP